MPEVDSSALITWYGSNCFSKNAAMSFSVLSGARAVAAAQTACQDGCLASATQPLTKATSESRKGSFLQSGSSIHGAGWSLPRYSTSGTGAGTGATASGGDAGAAGGQTGSFAGGQMSDSGALSATFSGGEAQAARRSATPAQASALADRAERAGGCGMAAIAAGEAAPSAL